jgi:hypothetical protein
VEPNGLVTCRKLTLEAGQAYHEELAQSGAEDRQEFIPLQGGTDLSFSSTRVLNSSHESSRLMSKL